MTTFFKSKLSLERLPMRIASAALLVSAAVAVGCGETDDPENPFGQQPSPSLPGAPGGVGVAPTGGAGGTTGAPVGPGPTTPGGGTTGGIVAPATAGGGLTGATGGGVTPGGTAGGVAGGGADSSWCKVKKITDAKCVPCHTTPLAAGAPFPLAKWEDFQGAGKGGKKIYERVGVRIHAAKAQAENAQQVVMPPGMELPADQRAIIDQWIAAGAPQGNNPTCAGSAPDPKPVDETWPLAECDAVYKITSHAASGVDAPYVVAPGAETHPQVRWDAPWGSEPVQAIAFKTITDNTTVLHHWILYANSGAFLTGWAPGEDGIKKMAPDVGMQMPSGAGSLRLDMHYNSLTQSKSNTDKSGVEVCVVKKAKFRKNNAAVTMGLSNIINLNIPPNSKNVEIKGSCMHTGAPVTLMSASPHAHTYARRMIFTVKKKNGQMITMLDQPFMFGDQKSYPLDPFVVVESGDTINTTCIYDNNTNARVTFGEDTGNEMCFNFASYYPAGALTCGLGGLGGLFGGGQ